MMAEQPKAPQGKAALHEEMLSRIADLESFMAASGRAWPPITKQDFLNIKKAIATLKAQPVNPDVYDLGVRAAQVTLTAIARKCVKNTRWLAILHMELTRLARSVSDWRVQA